MASIMSLQQLESLTLSGCQQIGDAGLNCLRSLSNLQSLSLWGCPGVTDAGLQHLQSLTKLRSLTISQFSNVTIAGLAALQSLPGLRQLNIYRCCQIHSPELLAFRKQMPHCRVINVSGPSNDALAHQRRPLAQSLRGGIAEFRESRKNSNVQDTQGAAQSSSPQDQIVIEDRATTTNEPESTKLSQKGWWRKWI